VIKIERKGLAIVLALAVVLLATQIVTVIPVQAAPKEKLNFQLYIEGIPVSYGPWGTYHGGPRGTELDNPEPKDLIQRTFHAKQVEFMFLNVKLTIGDETYYFDAVPSITGEWEFLCAGSYTHHYTITQYGITFTGYGYNPATGPGTYELIYGIINPMTEEVIMNGVYYSDADYTNPTGYSFTAALTIDPADGSMDGVLISQYDLPFVSTSGAAVDARNDFDITEEHSFNFNWNTLTGACKAKDTLTFYEADGETGWGTLAISSRDKLVYVFNKEGGLEDLVSEGNIFGKGTDALKDAKVEGTTSGEIAYWIPMQNQDTGELMDVQVVGLTREGTITGWTTPP
jgi:hypothetical protein